MLLRFAGETLVYVCIRWQKIFWTFLTLWRSGFRKFHQFLSLSVLAIKHIARGFSACMKWVYFQIFVKTAIETAWLDTVFLIFTFTVVSFW